MTRIGKYAIIFLAMLVFCLLPAAAQAEQGLIGGINITGEHLSQRFSFSPAQSRYTVYLDAPGTVQIDIEAAGSAVMLSANGSQALERLSLSRQITDERTVLSITARDGETQTITITFILKSDPAGGEPPADSPGGAEDDPNTPPADPPSAAEEPDPDDTAAADDDPDDYPLSGGEDPEGGEWSEQPEHGQPAALTTLTFQIGSYIMEVNGEPYLLDAAPRLISPGHTLVPVRFIAEALGGEVSWQPERQLVEIWLDGRYSALVIGETVPGTTVAATIYHSRTFVPLRYVMESFGAGVQWFGAEQVVFITYQKPA